MAFGIPNEAAAFNPNQAEPDSVDIDIIAAALAGDGVLDGCACTSNSNMTVAVAAGRVRIGGTYKTVTGGNVTITTADATNPRVDLIVVDNAAAKSVTAGTPAAEPVCPAIPANSIVLAMVYVPAGDTVIAANQITDKRCVVPFAGILDRQVTQLDINNLNTEQTFYTFDIPAGLLSTNRAVRLTILGDYLANSGAPTLTIKVKLGATTIYNDVTAAFGASATRFPLRMALMLGNQNSASVNVLGGEIQIGTLGGATAGLGDLATDETTAQTPLFGTAAENSANQLTLAVTVQHSVANAAVSIRRQYAILEIL